MLLLCFCLLRSAAFAFVLFFAALCACITIIDCRQFTKLRPGLIINYGTCPTTFPAGQVAAAGHLGKAGEPPRYELGSEEDGAFEE